MVFGQLTAQIFHKNTQYIPVVKIIAFLELEPRLNNKNGFNWAGKIEHFSKVSFFRESLIWIYNINYFHYAGMASIFIFFVEY
jgi:hypothetical protein